jgi:hypothetical protein
MMGDEEGKNPSTGARYGDGRTWMLKGSADLYAIYHGGCLFLLYTERMSLSLPTNLILLDLFGSFDPAFFL